MKCIISSKNLLLSPFIKNLMMAKLLLKDTAVKRLPPYIRQRLTLQSALLNSPQQYLRNMRYSERISKNTKKEVVIEEREIPKPVVVSETTQTKDVMDAETNTKTTLTLESQKSKLKSRCTTAWSKGARFATCSPYVEIARRLKQDLNDIHKKTIPAARESKKDLPGIKRRRGILKKVLEDVTLEGMCSTGTTTDMKQPTLDRILKENTIFLKYSKNCKSKKKRVRMEKKPAFSYFTKRPTEESFTAPSSDEEGEQRQKKLMLADIHDSSSEPSEDDASLERKPARLALRSSGDSDAAPDALSGAGPCVIGNSVSNMSRAPQLNLSEKLSRLHLQRQVPRLSVCAKPSQESPVKPLCRVPRERLYFKNMFSYFPGTHKR